MPASRTLPVAPFLAWADRLDGVAVIGAAVGFSHGALTRAMYRFRHEEKTTTVRCVDQYFVAADQPHMLAILYPQDIDIDDRWCPSCVELTTVDRADNLCPWCETPTECTLPIVELDEWGIH